MKRITILQQDGKVYGAAWTEDWYVHHIGIDNEKALPLLCGSKYLQSSIENTYQEVKSDLNTGRKVLFLGQAGGRAHAGGGSIL